MRIHRLFPALLLAALAIGRAEAHAHLVTADPAPDATVKAAPASLTLKFTEALEVGFCTVVVRDGGGTAVDRGDLHGLPEDPKALAIGLKPLGPGAYTVVWHATARDTHQTDGHFGFTVAP